MASNTLRARFTEQVVLLVSKDVKAAVNVAAREQGISQAAAARSFLHAGIKAAGYEVATTDNAASSATSAENVEAEHQIRPGVTA